MAGLIPVFHTDCVTTSTLFQPAKIVGPDKDLVTSTTYEQFDIYVDEATLPGPSPGGSLPKSRDLKGSAFVFSLFFAKVLRNGTPHFVGELRRLHNARNFVLDSVNFCTVDLYRSQWLQVCNITGSATKMEFSASLALAKGKRLHFVIKFKAQSEADQSHLDSALLKMLDWPSFSDAVLVTFALNLFFLFFVYYQLTERNISSPTSPISSGYVTNRLP